MAKCILQSSLGRLRASFLNCAFASSDCRGLGAKCQNAFFDDTYFRPHNTIEIQFDK